MERWASARAGAWCVLVAITLFAGVLAVTVGTAGTAYRWDANMLSDLGDPFCHTRGGRWICSPGHALFNAGLIAAGILLLLGAVMLRRRWGALLAAGVALMGFGLVVAGAFPAGGDGVVHLAGVVLALVAPGLALLASGVRPGTSWLLPGRTTRGGLAAVALAFCAESRLPVPLLPRGAGELIIVACLVVALGLEAGRIALARGSASR